MKAVKMESLLEPKDRRKQRVLSGMSALNYVYIAWSSVSSNVLFKNRQEHNKGMPQGWEQGWRSGESARLPPMCPGFDSRTQRHMWVEFVVGSLLYSERFLSGFPLSLKAIISKFQFDSGMQGHFRTSCRELLGDHSVGKQITFTFYCTGVRAQIRTAPSSVNKVFVVVVVVVVVVCVIIFYCNYQSTVRYYPFHPE